MITPDLQLMLESLERFEEIRRRAVRLGPRLCDLAYANPYQGVHERARDAIRGALEEDRLLSLQYSPFGGRTVIRRAVADALRQSHGLEFMYGDVVLTSGAMAALHVALRASGRPGGEVIDPDPVLDRSSTLRVCRGIDARPRAHVPGFLRARSRRVASRDD